MRFVFIVSYGRSGSTLLQKILNSSDGVCIRGENKDVLLHLAKAWAIFDEDIEMQKLRKSKTVPHDGNPWYGMHLTDGPRFGQGLADLFTQEVLCPPEGTRISGFKEIRWSNEPDWFEMRMAFLKRFFPGARFIINTRSHEGVANSGWWQNYDRADVFTQLRQAEDLLMSWMHRHQEISCHVHYDDYIRNIELLRPPYEMIGLDFDPQRIASAMEVRLKH
ncbi:sulfotransferase [Paracoccus sp. SCSIO 75233]|uniref:sulfotransferase n=1 Tax=Paracoccus sp. SCSIO 75233 TaxID=3017782 RepID=UPI0022F14400|nr:sulfotransferase [Paracoccus sp. SCSIO 75233]WBU55371.1 sulfotransferase [Paracoccus sp. SCSIO 75233]